MDTIPEDQPFQALQKRLDRERQTVPVVITEKIEPEIPPQNGYQKTKKISRRAFVFTGGVAAISALAFFAPPLIKKLIDQPSPPEPELVPQPLSVEQAPVISPPQVEAETIKVPEYLIEDYKLLNEALAQPIDYPEADKPRSKRQIKEQEYVDRVLAETDPKKKLERLDRGFLVVGDYRLRVQLIKERWKLRQEGKTGLRVLTDEEIAWAKSRNINGTTAGIHPEVLAICTDAYFQAREQLLKLKAEKGDKFLRYLRPDIFLMKEQGKLTPKLEAQLVDLSVDDFLMNPGAMAELVCLETDPKFPAQKDAQGKIIEVYPRYGIAYIGNVAAKPQLKTNTPVESNDDRKDRERQEKSLTKLIEKISADTKIPTGPNEFIQLIYNEHRIAGSQANKGDKRGGALGFQFMPATALDEYEFNQDSFGTGFNPFGLEAIVASYVMLSRGTISVNQSTGVKSMEKDGYLKGLYPRPGDKDQGESFRYDAVEKWNPHDYEINTVLKTADNYYEKIGEPGIWERKIVPNYRDRPIIFSPLYPAQKAA